MSDPRCTVKAVFGGDGVVGLTLIRSNPTAAVAAGMLREVIEAADRLSTSFPENRVVVLSAEATDLTLEGEGGASLRCESSLLRRSGEACAALRGLPQPVIAKVRGRWDGVVAWLALACDLVVVETSAEFTRMLGGRGPAPAERLYVLTRIVGTDKVNQLTAHGENFSAAQALRTGIVNRVVGSEDLEGFVSGWAADLIGAPPLDLALSKRLLNEAFELMCT